jgi:hypothetical protein
MTSDDRSSRRCAPTPSGLSAYKCSPRRRACFPTGAVRQRPRASRERDASALAPLVDPRQPAHDRARRRAARARRQPLCGLGSCAGVRRRCDGKPLARLPREPGAHEIAHRLPRDCPETRCSPNTLTRSPRDGPDIGPRFVLDCPDTGPRLVRDWPVHALEPSHLSACKCSPRRPHCVPTGVPRTRWSHRTSGWPPGRRVGGDARVR